MNSQISKQIQTQSQIKPSSFNKAYFAPKSELLAWASKLLDIELTTLEEMSTGAIFSQLLDACHPGTVRLNKVNWKANCETDYISNFKIFQQGLIVNNINKPIDINRLSKGKQYDLNELLQWIYGYYLNTNDIMREVYNAKKNRGGKIFIFNNKKNEIKKKYKKKLIRENSKDKDNLTQISTASNNLSSNNSINGDVNYRNNMFNVSNLRQNLRNNNYHIYTTNNINNNEDNKYRNKSKQEMKNNKYYEFEERIMNNNCTQNKNNMNNINNIYTYNNNIYNTMNRRYPSNSNINMNNEEINNNNNIVSSSSKRNFKNIFEKTPSDYKNFMPSQFNNNLSSFDVNLNYAEDDLNNELENENNLDMTDFFGLNEEEMKKLIKEEKKDGNGIRDLKNIIRKLRINLISKEKELTNIKKAISEEYKLKNFYLNKLKDIEYLYFNPVIKNTNENKNTILRQLLCSNQDTTIFLDENNYAFLRNINNNKKSVLFSNKKSNKKIDQNDISVENKISNNINENNISQKNEDKNNNLNISSRKNYNANNRDNLFDFFNDNNKIENNINNNFQQNQRIIPIKFSRNESKITQISSYQNDNNISNFSYNNGINQKEDSYINYQKDNGKTNYFNNGNNYFSEKKKENVNNENIKEINNRTEFKFNNNIYLDISSQLLNESLHIPYL